MSLKKALLRDLIPSTQNKLSIVLEIFPNINIRIMNYRVILTITIWQLLAVTGSTSIYSQNLIEVFSNQLQNDGYKIEKIITSRLPEKSSLTYGYNFDKGKTYKILAFSDNADVHDIDLFLRNNLGNTIKVDKHYHSHAALVFKPQQNGEYIVSALLYNSLSDILKYPCTLIVAAK